MSDVLAILALIAIGGAAGIGGGVGFALVFAHFLGRKLDERLDELEERFADDASPPQNQEQR